MGVPGLFAFLKRRYGVIARYVVKKEDGTWDGAAPADALYVDMNHIIHTCTHAGVAADGLPYNEDAAFARMEAYLSALMEVAGAAPPPAAAAAPPTPETASPSGSSSVSSSSPSSSLRLLFVAIDGVAPIAKMNQQRTRRFLSAHVAEVTERVEREVRSEMASQAGGQRAIPDPGAEGRFDPNIISPGTAFMARVAAGVRDMMRHKVETDPRFAQLMVVVSDSYEPAEGEHKIMRFIRHVRTRPEYDPNTRHVIYGQDADLLLLSLLLHEPHVRILREGMMDPNSPHPLAHKGGARQRGRQQGQQGAAGAGAGAAAAMAAAGTAASSPSASTPPVAPVFEEVDIGLLRECLQWEFAELCGAPDGRPLAHGGVYDDVDLYGNSGAETPSAGVAEGCSSAAEEAKEAAEEEEEAAESADMRDLGEVEELGAAAAEVEGEEAAATVGHGRAGSLSTRAGGRAAEGGAGPAAPQAAVQPPLTAPEGPRDGLEGSVSGPGLGPPPGWEGGAGRGSAAGAPEGPVASGGGSGVGAPSQPAGAVPARAIAAAAAVAAAAAIRAAARSAGASTLPPPLSPSPPGPGPGPAAAAAAVSGVVSVSGGVATAFGGGGQAAAAVVAVAATHPVPPTHPHPHPHPHLPPGSTPAPPPQLLPPALALALGRRPQPTPGPGAAAAAPAATAPPPAAPPPALSPAAAVPQHVDEDLDDVDHLLGLLAPQRAPPPPPPPAPPPPPPAPPPPPPPPPSAVIAAMTAMTAAAAATMAAAEGWGAAAGGEGGRCRGWWPASPFLDRSAPTPRNYSTAYPSRGGGRGAAAGSGGGGGGYGAYGRGGFGSRSTGGTAGGCSAAAVASAAVAFATSFAGGSGSGSSAGAAAGGSGSGSARGGAPPAAEVQPPPQFDFEQVLEDLVVLTFLAGNDFLPHVPSIDIYDLPSGLDLLLAAYKALLPEMRGCITQGSGQINQSRLTQLLARLARDEEAAFVRRAEHRRRSHQKAREKAAADEGAFWDAASALLGPGGVSVGELPPGVDLDAVLSGLALSPDLAVALGLDWALPSLDLATASDQQLRQELAKRVSQRTQERVMAGDPWAADPCALGLPGYRSRYYLARFPEVHTGGDVDKIAARVVRSYMDGLSWVYRYYCLGPAALDFVPHVKDGGGDQCRTTVYDHSTAPDGASWTWAYPHHYAPLMSDLASAKIQGMAFRGRSRTVLTSAPIRMTRELYDMAYCSLDEWAPTYGPVRPLLQLLCILPPRSAQSALPSELASVLLIAHELEDTEEGAEPGEGAGGHHDEVEEGAGGRGRRKTGGRGRGSRTEEVDHQAGAVVVAAAAAAPRGPRGPRGGGRGAGFSVLLTSAADRILADSSSEAGSSGDEQGPPGGLGEEGGAAGWGRFGLALQPGVGGSWGLDGEGALSLHLLAQRVARYFPNNIPPLVDLSGKKHLHTAVVRLPVVHPPLLAHVIQEALRCGMELGSEAKSRNRMLPAEVVVSEHLYRLARAACESEGGGDGTSGDGGATSSGGAGKTPAPAAVSGSSAPPRLLWHLLLRPHPPTPTPPPGPPGPSAPSTPPLPPPASSPSAASAAPGPSVGGALGLLLAQRGRPPAPAPSPERVPVAVLDLDVAGLPVASTRAALLAGAQPPPLRVDRGSWRRLEAAAARGRQYAERVLGLSKGGRQAGGWGSGANTPPTQANAAAVGTSQEYMMYGGGGGGGGAALDHYGGQSYGGGRGHRGSGRGNTGGRGEGFAGRGAGARGGRGEGRSGGRAGGGGVATFEFVYGRGGGQGGRGRVGESGTGRGAQQQQQQQQQQQGAYPGSGRGRGRGGYPRW